VCVTQPRNTQTRTQRTTGMLSNDEHNHNSNTHAHTHTHYLFLRKVWSQRKKLTRVFTFHPNCPTTFVVFVLLWLCCCVFVWLFCVCVCVLCFVFVFVFVCLCLVVHSKRVVCLFVFVFVSMFVFAFVLGCGPVLLFVLRMLSAAVRLGGCLLAVLCFRVRCGTQMFVSGCWNVLWLF